MEHRGTPPKDRPAPTPVNRWVRSSSGSTNTIPPGLRWWEFKPTPPGEALRYQRPRRIPGARGIPDSHSFARGRLRRGKVPHIAPAAPRFSLGQAPIRAKAIRSA